ncbi:MULTISPECIES: porin [Pseudoalteromonas]|uniref:porin n=1 Tax=Pseudoalteromonas TaxID=53246 RepID=UPI0006BB0768|nr:MULTISPECIES: porin [Pseudoalteromonas]
MALCFLRLFCIITVIFSSYILAEPIKIYGRAHLGLLNSDIGQGNETSIENYSSRLGVKGYTQIGKNLEAVYKFEFAVNIDNNADTLTSRNQYVGLKGNFGQVVIGRHDTALKVSQGKLDVMNDFSGDLKSFFNGDNRLGDVMHYSSPKLGELQLIVTYVADKNEKQNDETGISMAAVYGDSKLKKTTYYISVAHDSKVAGYDISRATVQGKVGPLVLGAMYQEAKNIDTDISAEGYLVSASYKIDKYKLLAQYQDNDGIFGKLKDSGTGASVGIERSVSKKIRMYMWYTQFSLDGKNNQDHLALTLRYDF